MMKKLFDEPHRIFLISAPIILLIGIWSSESVLDINVHDAYFVIAYLYLAIMISTIFAIIGIGYWIMHKTKRKLSKWLNWIHIGLTFCGPLIMLILAQFYRKEITEYDFNNNLTLIIVLLFLLIVLGQIIFPINIIYSLTQRGK